MYKTWIKKVHDDFSDPIFEKKVHGQEYHREAGNAETISHISMISC